MDCERRMEGCLGLFYKLAGTKSNGQEMVMGSNVELHVPQVEEERIKVKEFPRWVLFGELVPVPLDCVSLVFDTLLREGLPVLRVPEGDSHPDG